MTWQVMGLRRKIQRDLIDSGLPEDLTEEFHRFAEWAGTLPERFGGRVRLGVVDVASIQGFFKSLVRGFTRYPAFTVDGRRYVGADFARVDALIVERLADRRAPVARGPTRKG